MTKKAKNHESLIIGICAVLIIIIIVLIAAASITSSSVLSDSFFVTNETKYVIPMNNSALEAEAENIKPNKIYTVYNHSGEKIDSMFTYVELNDVPAAQEALEILKDKEFFKEAAESFSVNGKYVVIELRKEIYENSTFSDILDYQSTPSSDE